MMHKVILGGRVHRAAARAALGTLSIAALLCGATGELVAQHLEVQVHDPVMAKQGDTYYIFTTGRGISAWSSKDMLTWERAPQVHEMPPAWTENVVAGFSERN